MIQLCVCDEVGVFASIQDQFYAWLTTTIRIISFCAKLYGSEIVIRPAVAYYKDGRVVAEGIKWNKSVVIGVQSARLIKLNNI